MIVSNDCSIPQHDSSESQRLDLNVVADETEETVIIKNLEDPAEWGIIDRKLRVELVEMGPIQKKNIIYPKDTHGRKFNYSYYNRKMENGELVPRTWLIYSEKLDRVFCFCCKLFASNKTNSFLDGYSDWRNLSTSLHRHETNLTHMRIFLQWKDLDKSLKNKTTIEYQTQSLYEMEKRHWRSALERIIEIIKFLASQNIAFRGSSDKLYESNNGNFLKLIELFAKFDPVIENHIHRALQPNNKVHYLSKKSQNELLEILSKAIRDKILLSLRKSKYYSIILDCTPDARRGLCSTIIDNLKKWNIPIEDMRGQGYDNGANMKGKNNGLQKLLLTKSPRAFFVPCAAHTLNLMINDAAKQPSDTRWESRINAIRPLRYQLGEVYDALFDIVNNENFNKEIQHEAQALESIENLKIFMQDYRSELKFEDVLKTAKELSEEVDGEQEFKSSSEVRQRKKKRQFDYEQHDECPRSPQEKFKLVVVLATEHRFER
ncbi:zinc finger MYM-type protein 1-like [Ctenocephalides felis]|uniref:zinc finger MYM-type protein 1-like n=1 Tax=Ctenocephalides felis TaxID=7515 RepID=UPI000E6E3907|nr:zinc finger MYM-type protein 1-like [Ctenocephalides felis]